MANLSLTMYKDAIQAVVEGNSELATTIISQDDEVDNFSFLLLRLLRSITRNISLAAYVGLELIDCFDYQFVIHRLEHIADNAVNISNSVLVLYDMRKKLPAKLKDRIMEMGMEVYDLCEDAIKSFFTKDIEAANHIIEAEAELKRRLTKETLEEIKRMFKGGEEDPILMCTAWTIKGSIFRVADAGAEIAEVAINSIVGRKKRSITE